MNIYVCFIILGFVLQVIGVFGYLDSTKLVETKKELRV